MIRSSFVSIFASALLPALAIAPLSACATEPFGKLTVEEVAAELGKTRVYLFDVNPRSVYEAGHLPGARSVWRSIEASDLPADKNARLVFYCKNPH
jgi:hypothetical protein